jgi:thiamine biosynthesis lipoprotein
MRILQFKIVFILLFAIIPCLGGFTFRVQQPVSIDGLTMGTTYHVVYFDARQRDFKHSIDSLLLLVNKSINTYDPSSEVSIFNKSGNGIAFKLPYLYPPLKKALEISEVTRGAFAPTIMPLVNVWGFGPDKSLQLSKKVIDSVRAFVGYGGIVLTSDSVKKLDPRVQLDFGGIGQGYGADVIADFLKSKAIVNFLVELGGEGLAYGKNLTKNDYWTIGILDPSSTRDNQFYKAYVSVSNRSFTTSGNYFNYREINGKKYGHTIDPRTGYPVDHELLSVSVFAEDCTVADAWDTALLVMGYEKAVAILERNPNLDALLIYTSPEGEMKTYLTPGLKKLTRFEQN